MPSSFRGDHTNGQQGARKTEGCCVTPNALFIVGGGMVMMTRYTSEAHTTKAKCATSASVYRAISS